MKKFYLLALIAAMLLAGQAAWADGDFYVIVAGGGVGTKITSLPYTITQPGFYYLGGNLTTTGSNNGITVEANDVTIDLMGFSLTNTAFSGYSYGIYMYHRNNVRVRNGTVRGFYVGIFESSTSGANHRIMNVSCVNNGSTTGHTGIGILLYGYNHLVKGCIASSNGYGGIYVANGTISECAAYDNYNYGIQLWNTGTVLDNIANNTTSYGFYLGSGNIVVDRNSASGNGTNYYGGPSNPAYWGINAGK